MCVAFFYLATQIPLVLLTSLYFFSLQTTKDITLSFLRKPPLFMARPEVNPQIKARGKDVHWYKADVGDVSEPARRKLTFTIREIALGTYFLIPALVNAVSLTFRSLFLPSIRPSSIVSRNRSTPF